MTSLPHTYRLLPLLPVAAIALAACGSDDDGSDAIYLPESGDDVIVFTHVFTEEGYEEGKQLVTEQFPAAMQESGQTRRTYFIENPDENRVIAVSFFDSDSDADEWLESVPRQEVLDQLEPLRAEPLGIEQFSLETIANNSPDD